MKSASGAPGCPQTCDSKRRLARSQRPSDDLFVLVDGVLASESILVDGRRQIVGLHVPGDVCGLTASSNGRGDRRMLALSPVSYIPVPRSLVSHYARESADFSQALWRELSREAAIFSVWIVNLGRRSAYERIAHLMCELEARLRAAAQDTTAGVVWPGNQADMSAATGLSLVHVNKTLRRLAAAEHVGSGRHLRFQDVTKLGAAAGFDPSYLAVEGEPLGEMLLSCIGARDKVGTDIVWDRSLSASLNADASSTRL